MDFVGYVVWVCEQALERGVLPHTNLGVLVAADLARLREVTASQGLMLESVNPRPDRAPGLADEAPGGPAGDDQGGGRPADPVHERDPRRHRRDAGGASRRARGARGRARRVRSHPGGDPPELRPAPELLRAGAGARSPTPPPRDYWRTGLAEGPQHEAPKWASPVTIDDLAADRRDPPAAPGVGVQVPPNLSGLVAGARRRRRDRSRRPVRQRRPHLARASVPSPAQVRKRLARRTVRAVGAALRLLGVHRSRVDLPGRARRDQARLLVVHPAARLAAGAAR